MLCTLYDVNIRGMMLTLRVVLAVATVMLV